MSEKPKNLQYIDCVGRLLMELGGATCRMPDGKPNMVTAVRNEDGEYMRITVEFLSEAPDRIHRCAIMHESILRMCNAQGQKEADLYRVCHDDAMAEVFGGMYDQ